MVSPQVTTHWGRAGVTPCRSEEVLTEPECLYARRDVRRLILILPSHGTYAVRGSDVGHNVGRGVTGVGTVPGFIDDQRRAESDSPWCIGILGDTLKLTSGGRDLVWLM